MSSLRESFFLVEQPPDSKVAYLYSDDLGQEPFVSDVAGALAIETVLDLLGSYDVKCRAIARLLRKGDILNDTHARALAQVARDPIEPYDEGVGDVLYKARESGLVTSEQAEDFRNAFEAIGWGQSAFVDRYGQLHEPDEPGPTVYAVDDNDPDVTTPAAQLSLSDVVFQFDLEPRGGELHIKPTGLHTILGRAAADGAFEHIVGILPTFEGDRPVYDIPYVPNALLSSCDIQLEPLGGVPPFEVE